MIVWRGWGGLIPLMLVVMTCGITYLHAIEFFTGSANFIFGTMFLATGVVAWYVGRPLNKALEERYGQAERKFKLRDVFEIDEDAWMRTVEPSRSRSLFAFPYEVTKTPFHSFGFIKMEYWLFILAFAALIAFVWNFLPWT